MSIRDLSNNTKITTKIYFGFLLVLGLLVGLGTLGVVDLTSASNRSSEQTAVSRNVQSVRAIDGMIGQMRLQAVYFTFTGNKDFAEKAQQVNRETLEALDKLSTRVHSTEDRQLVSRLTDLAKQYGADFSHVFEERNRRDRLVETGMNVVGEQARENLEQISEDAMKTHAHETAAWAGHAANHLMLARVFALKFLSDPTDEALKKSNAEIGEFQEALKDLKKTLVTADSIALANTTSELAERYKAIATEVGSLTAAYSKVLNESLRPNGEAFARIASQLVDHMSGQLDTLEANTEAANSQAIDTSVALALGTVVLGLFIAWIIARSITRPVVGMTEAMTKLAEGDSEITVPALGNRDEIGEMAKALEIFRQNAIARMQLEADQKAERAAKERRQQAVDRLIEDFSSTMAGCLGSVSTASQQMLSTATKVSVAADETRREVHEANDAASVSSSAVEAVAAAAEELSASITEISSQVVRTANEAAGAAADSRSSKEQMDTLVANSMKIGQIVDLITDIAAQTNLLALNATIEAARAGDAGRGFAVVAGEVKGLANQTANATQEIVQQVGAIQEATSSAARVIETISNRVETISNIAAAVAAAVEEQGAATREIAERTQQVATSTTKVTTSVSAVQGAADTSSSAATEVSVAAETVTTQASELQKEVEHFLHAVQSSEERRRFERIRVSIDAVLRLPGGAQRDRILDISAGGARLSQRHPVNRGDSIEIEITGLGLVRARIAGVSSAGTHLQFPMDATHLKKVETFIEPLRKAAA